MIGKARMIVRRAAMTLLLAVVTGTTAWANDYAIKYDNTKVHCTPDAVKISNYCFYFYTQGTTITLAPAAGFTFHDIRITSYSGRDFTYLLGNVTYDVPGTVSFRMPAEDIGIEVDLTPPSGSFGNNNTLSWALTDEDDNDTFETLTISGTGDIGDSCPWALFKDMITTVNIGDGVTSIGSQAFSSCENLKMVVVQRYHSEETPAITSLGANAFDGCSALSKICVPDDAIEAYKGASNWSQYENMIQAIIVDHGYLNEGTQANPYIISTQEQLDLLATRVNSGTDYAGTYFMLGADIAYAHMAEDEKGAATENNFTPIGTDEHPFKGTFLGNGKKITGIRVYNTSLNYAGLFGVVSDATLDGVVIEDASITAAKYCGGLVGGILDGDVEIRNCVSSAEVVAGEFAGGLIGYVDGTADISHCRADGYVSGAGNVGGFVGCIDGSNTVRVTKCVARGDVHSTKNNYGGFIGQVNDKCATISDCWCSGAVWGTGGNIGPFVGLSMSYQYLNFSVYPYSSGPRYVCGSNRGMFGHVLTASQVADRSKDKDGTPWPAVKKHTHGLTPIATADDLRAVANNLAGCYVLVNDIVIDGQHEPIGTATAPFTGEFYGQGHRISSYRVETTETYAGLFGNIAGGRVNGLLASGSVSRSEDINVTIGVGGFAGGIQAKSLVDDCSFTGEVSCTAGGSTSGVGGFVGRTYDSPVILRCGAHDITVSNSSNKPNTGGFVGDHGYGYIKDAYAIGEVTGYVQCVGGFAGNMGMGARIANAWCSSHVESQGKYLGAFVGQIYKDGIDDKTEINLNRLGINLVTDSYYDITCNGEKMLAAGTETGPESNAATANVERVYKDCPGITGINDTSNQQNFQGFDFDTIWMMDENNPVFQWSSPYHEIDMNASGIRTYASTVALDFSMATSETDGAELTAYIVSAFDGTAGTLTLTPVSKVPAHTGLLLKGTANTAFDVPVAASATAPTQNYLVGVTDDNTTVSPTEERDNVNYTNFILANGKYGIDWYTLSSAGAIGANKAYLSLPTADLNLSSRGFTWVYENEQTGIRDANETLRYENENQNENFYDLQGRRVAQPTKGLYIHNGKKIVIK